MGLRVAHPLPSHPGQAMPGHAMPRFASKKSLALSARPLLGSPPYPLGRHFLLTAGKGAGGKGADAAHAVIFCGGQEYYIDLLARPGMYLHGNGACVASCGRQQCVGPAQLSS